MSSVHHQRNEEDPRSPKNVARAQAQDPDIDPLVDQVLWKWKKPTVEELQPESSNKGNVGTVRIAGATRRSALPAIRRGNFLSLAQNGLTSGADRRSTL